MQETILRSIVTGQRAWTAEVSLCRAAGCSEDDLAVLEEAGWLARWDQDSRGEELLEPAWTLTPFAAASLGVEIHERSDETPRWFQQDDPIPSPRVRRGRQMRSLHGLPEPPAPPAPEVLIDDEGRAIEILGRTIQIDPRLKPLRSRRARKGKCSASRSRRQPPEAAGSRFPPMQTFPRITLYGKVPENRSQ